MTTDTSGPQEDRRLRTYQEAVAIITGGASGIGRALAEELSRRGAEVVLADRQIELAEEVAEGIREAGGMATAAEVDVTDFAAMQSLVQNTLATLGRLDYFFNNAGIGIGGEVRHYEIEDWHQILDVNLHGVVHGIQAAYPIMIQQGYGHIVNTASMAGLMPAPWSVSYAATKHAVVGLSTSLRIEAAALGVRISVLCPGVIDTPILQSAGKYGKMLQPIAPEVQRAYWRRLRPMPADRFAYRTLNALARNQAIIVLPSWWRIIWWINRLSPSLGLHLSRRFYSAALKAMLAEGDGYR
ncbi:MAG TPA: SDR family oxidoreductase [Gemmataceae bacterium]|nr:SDR family oxidoreductase [Gemmataceae bacterium]